MSLVNKLAKLARSPQGRRLADRAVRAARDPKTRQQIAHVSRKFAAGRTRKP